MAITVQRRTASKSYFGSTVKQQAVNTYQRFRSRVTGLRGTHTASASWEQDKYAGRLLSGWHQRGKHPGIK